MVSLEQHCKVDHGHFPSCVAQPDTQKLCNFLRDLRLPLRLKWVLPSSGLLYGVKWLKPPGQLHPLRRERQVVPKRRYQTTLHRATTQKTEEFMISYSTTQLFSRFSSVVGIQSQQSSSCTSSLSFREPEDTWPYAKLANDNDWGVFN